MKTKLLALGLAATMAFSISGPATTHAAEAAKPFDLTILHLNDHHSHLDSQSYDLNLDYDDTQKDEKVRVKLGGMSYISSLINANKNDHSLYLESGELNGTLYFSLYKGETDMKVLNAMKPDAYMVGNHEFDEGDKRLAELIDMAKFPILSGNIKPNSKTPLYGKLNKPYMIKEVNGQKVAIIGVIKIDKTKGSSLVSDDVDFVKEVDFVKSTVEEVKKQGINKIILLSHLGYDFDQVMAAQTTDIDLIVGGDTHNLLDSSGEAKALGLPVTGEYPTVVKNANAKDTYIVQAWEYANVLGKIYVKFNEQGEVISAVGGPIAPVGGPYQINKDKKWVDADEATSAKIKDAIAKSKILVEGKANPAVDDIIKPYREAVKAKMAEEIGSIQETLSNERIPKPFTDAKDANGSFAAQVVADSFLENVPNADVAIQNAGGVRENFLQGKYTMADAYTMLPFSNTITTLKITGEEICNVLDEAIRYSQGVSQSTGSFPYSSSLRYDVYLNAGDGVKSAYNVEIKDKKTGKWSPIDMKKKYVVVTNSFTALGKDGYVTFAKAIEKDPNVKDETHVEYAVPLVELFTKHLKGGELAKPDADDYSIKSVKEWKPEMGKPAEAETPAVEPTVKPTEPTVKPAEPTVKPAEPKATAGSSKTDKGIKTTKAADKKANTAGTKAKDQSTKTYTVVKGDSLTKIAEKTFNDAKQWRKIYELNKDKIKNPNFIYPGQVIVLQ